MRPRCGTRAGFEVNRALADPSQLTDLEDPTLANVVLTNGARLYVDHAHPEYSVARGHQPASRGDVGPRRRAHHARGGPAAYREPQ